VPIEPNETNGLRAICRLMVDKITTVPKTKIGARVGRLADDDMVRLNRAVLVFLVSRPRARASNWNRHMLHAALADCPVGIEEVIEREPYALRWSIPLT
jgi:PemK-like, MazF-like toxin of type II toxin-antitoxin system